MVTDNSKTHINPVDYFDPNAPVPEQPLTSKYFYPAFFPVLGLVSVCGLNLANRKPILSGIQRHILAAGIGLVLGFGVDTQIRKWNSRRDDTIYHYIITHPEDFPPIERVKYKNILEKWIPHR